MMPVVRRLLRFIRNALTVLSLLLCVTTCIFWSRSHQHLDSLTLLKDRAYSIASHGSELWIEVDTPLSFFHPLTYGSQVSIQRETYRDDWKWQTSWGLEAQWSRLLRKSQLYHGGSLATGFGTEVWYCFAPHWLIRLTHGSLPKMAHHTP